jgi:hypothetical protein
MKTYITFYEKEIRAVEILIRDQNDAAYTIDSATVKVVDNEDVVIVAETVALVNGNSVSFLINTSVTSNAGEYDIIWKLIKGAYTFYHKTRLVVEDL